MAIEFSFDTDDGVVDVVADIESFDIEPALGFPSNCDVLLRLAAFLFDGGSVHVGGVSLISLAGFGDMVGVWPICDTVLHRLPSGGYFARTLSPSSLVV